jgi:hypothetical protein
MWFIRNHQGLPMTSGILENLMDKSMSAAALKEKVLKNPALLPEVLAGVHSSKASIRYGCSKVLLELSEDHPELLYPHMDFFIDLLDSKYRILTWNALAVIARLTRVDTQKKFDAIFKKYYGFLQSEYMVTVANVVGNSGIIAKAKPYLIPRITKELLTVGGLKTGKHLTAECKLVIAEKTIEAFDMFFDKVQSKQDVMLLVKGWCTSRRTRLRDKAQRFIQRWNEETR